jgi:hypothetical protein
LFHEKLEQRAGCGKLLHQRHSSPDAALRQSADLSKEMAGKRRFQHLPAIGKVEQQPD